MMSERSRMACVKRVAPFKVDYVYQTDERRIAVLNKTWACACMFFAFEKAALLYHNNAASGANIFLMAAQKPRINQSFCVITTTIASL